MIESARREWRPNKTPWTFYGLLLVSEWMVLQVFHLHQLFLPLGVVSHLCMLVILEVHLLILVNRIRREWQSKSLWLIMGVLALFIVSNLTRVVLFFTVDRLYMLLDGSWISNASIMINYMSVVFYCYGYWGFVIEKNQRTIVQKTEEAVLAREGEKLAMVGQLIQSGALSASVAHEINQPLASIQLNTEEAIRINALSPTPHLLSHLLGRIATDNQRAAQIVQRVRDLFRQSQAIEEIIHPDQVIERFVKVHQVRMLQAGVQLDLSLEAGCGIRFPLNEFDHVLLNVFSNAMDALEHVHPKERKLHIQTWKDANWVHIVFADSGPGLDPSVKSNLFDLLRSTKTQGMGLGLWLTRYIVERHGGQIHHRDAPGRGAIFHLQLTTDGAES